MKTKTLQIPLYFGTLTLIDGTIKEVFGKHNFTHDHRQFSAVSFFEENKGYTKYYLAVEIKTAKNIAHEALHLVNFIFKHRAIQLDLENDEPSAYLLGWIVFQAHRFFKLKKD